jgi:uncharacterized membrane protein
MKREAINIILLAAPIAIGGIIAALNSDSINNTTENAEAWARKTQSNISLKRGWFSRYIINPILWIIVKFCDWTDGFTHRGLKNGVRVAATLYLVAAWLFILYSVFMIAVILAVVVIVLYIISKVLINSDNDIKQGYEKGKSVFNSNYQNRQDDANDYDGETEIYRGGSFSGTMVGYVKKDKVYQGGVFSGTLVGYIKGNDIYRGGDFTGTKVGYLKDNDVYRGGDFTGTMIGYIDGEEIYSGGTFTGAKVGYTKGGRRIEGAAALLLLL